MRIKIFFCLMLGAMLAVPVGAMPPRPGVKEPASLGALRLMGLDSPRDGLIQQLRTKDASAKISGSREYPVVMGYFTDSGATYTQSNFQTMLFSAGSGVKSVNNYYRDMSYNAMSCSGSVANWVSSGNTVAYFGGGNNGLNNGTTANTYEFIKKVLARADSFVNFSASSYDLNHDGYVDVLWVIHAGKGGEEGGIDPIWSHSFQLTGWTGGTYFLTNETSPYTGEKVRIDKYIIMPERTNYADGVPATTEMIGAGVFAHEFGHALGLPDLYDTGGDPAGSGLGLFSLMAAGSWGGDYNSNATPVSLDVWCKRFLGWLAPFTVQSNSLYSVNSTLSNSSNSSYKLSKGGSDTTMQYWLVENRWRTAVGPVSNVAWDANLLGQGLGIYHIDSNYTTTTYINNNNLNNNSTDDVNRDRPLGVALEETDQTSVGYSSELWYGNNSGESVDIWNSGNQANFDSSGTAYPVSYYNGTNSTTAGPHAGVAIRQIPAASAAMSCNMFVIPGGGSDFNIGLMYNPAFIQYLTLAAVSGNPMPSTPVLDTALMTVSAQVETLSFAKISDWTYNCEYELKTEGQHHLHLAAVDSGGTWRRGDRYFEGVLAKATGSIITPKSAAIMLDIPAGALARDLYLAVFDHQASNLPGRAIVSPVQIGPAGMALLKPSTLEFAYNQDDLDGMDESRMGIYQLRDSGWGYLPGQIDKNSRKVMATINTLGVYVLSWDINNPALEERTSSVTTTAWPNPFHTSVNVKYQVMQEGNFSISIYNILGQKIKDVSGGYRLAGQYDFNWDGRDGKGRKVAPGIYYYRVSGGSANQTGRMVMVK